MAVNMRKIVSPTSSETTSETQSVDDNNPGGSGNLTPPITNTLNRNSKNWKRMKDSGKEESDSKRPPWRAVSVSTLPKPDKNALLKAKLLDASRRLRSGKASLAIQTDIEPTKLMRDAAISTQTDLVLYRDVSIMTDGSYAKRKQMLDEFILTYSVSQMTEGLSVQDSSTQTLLPKINSDDFLSAYFNTNLTLNDMQKFTKIEQQLLQQIQQIRDFKNESGIMTNTLKTVDDLKQNEHKSEGFPLQSTFGSWNFEYDTNPGGYVLESFDRGYLKWPLPLPTSGGMNAYNIKIFFLAIGELIQESAKLVNFLSKLHNRTESRKLEVQKKLEAVVEFQPQPLVLPSSYWHAKIKEQEEQLNNLAKKEKKLQNLAFK